MIVRLIVALSAMLFALAPAAADAINEHVKFWDDGPQDASFVKFRDALKATIAHKDAKALMKIVAPNIKNSFDTAEDGAAKFSKGWKLEDPKSAIWPALSLVVEMGGNFDSKTMFSAPYVFSAFPSDVDGFDKVVVTKEGAVLRAQPNAQGQIIRKLDHDILTVVGTLQDDLVLSGNSLPPQHECRPGIWALVKDAKGVGGGVPACDVRSPIDYRAAFEKKKGSWLMTSFLAGD